MRVCLEQSYTVVIEEKNTKMEFDPTKDYYGLDFSEETNQVIWNYWEFIKNLVTLSSPADQQREIIGFGAVADEMAIDFESYYILNSQRYLDHELLTENQVTKLNFLDVFFDKRSGDKMPEFWDDEILDSHPDWATVRKISREILEQLGYGNLEIQIERTTEKSKSNSGESLIIESTKTRLKKKSTS